MVEGGREGDTTRPPREQLAQLVNVNRARAIGVRVEELVELHVDAHEQLVKLVEIDLVVAVLVVFVQEQPHCRRIEARARLALAQCLVQLVVVDPAVVVVVDVVEQALQVLGLVPSLYKKNITLFIIFVAIEKYYLSIV